MAVGGVCQLSALPKSTAILEKSELLALCSPGQEEGDGTPWSQAHGEGSPPDLATSQPSTAKKAERKLNLKERLEICVASERQRLTFGKVCPLLPTLP